MHVLKLFSDNRAILPPWIFKLPLDSNRFLSISNILAITTRSILKLPLWSYREATVSAVRKWPADTVARHKGVPTKWAALFTHISGKELPNKNGIS